MTPPQVTASLARTVRLIHGAFIIGVVLFAIVSRFTLRPTLGQTQLAPMVPQVMFGVSAAAIAASLLLRRRVPRRSISDSADLFWSTAMAPALVMWAPLEAACLLSVIAWGFTGSPVAVAIGVVAVLIFIVQNPARLENPES